MRPSAWKAQNKKGGVVWARSYFYLTTTNFGWMILTYVRTIHRDAADYKIVCCPKTEECLFPSASEFFHDYVDPTLDSEKCGTWLPGWSRDRARKDIDETNKRIVDIFKPRDVEVWDGKNDCHWHMSNLVKFQPTWTPILRATDVVIAPRHRALAKDKNWDHWSLIAKNLQKLGLRVGVVGREDTSTQIEGAINAWRHPYGATAGTVDLLRKCKLYCGTDTGVSHLAALMDIPMVIFRKETPGNIDLTGIMQRATTAKYYRLPDSAWDRPDEVLGAIIREL